MERGSTEVQITQKQETLIEKNRDLQMKDTSKYTEA